MTGMDRFQGALQLQEQAQRLGVVPGGMRLAAAYLAGDAAALAQETAAIALRVQARAESYGRLADYGLYLDNAGRMVAGAALWRSAARVPECVFDGLVLRTVSAGAGRSGSCTDEDLQPG